MNGVDRIKPLSIRSYGLCTTDGCRRYSHERLFRWRGAVNAVPLNCSAWRFSGCFCGEFCPTGNAPFSASVAKSLPNPLMYPMISPWFRNQTMARPAGFEPAARSLEGCCSIHLSYGRMTTKIRNACRGRRYSCFMQQFSGHPSQRYTTRRSTSTPHINLTAHYKSTY